MKLVNKGYICLECLKECSKNTHSLIPLLNTSSRYSKGSKWNRKRSLYTNPTGLQTLRSNNNNITSLKTRYYHSGSSNHTALLQQEYQKALAHLVENNVEPIQTFLKTQTNSNSSSDPLFSKIETQELDMLQSLVDDSFTVSQLIRHIASLLNKSYTATSLERSKIRRYDAPLVEYNWFLTMLYPRNGRINYSKLYDAYNALPSPRPLCIAPKHLEDLLSALMSPTPSTNKTEATRAIHANVLNDLEETGMPISQHEINSLLEMALKGYQEDVEMVLKMKNGTRTGKNGNTNNSNNDVNIPPLSQTLFGSESVVVAGGSGAAFDNTKTSFSQPEIASTVSSSFLPSLEQVEKVYTRINANPDLEISTINILYRFALKSKDNLLATKTVESLQNGAASPDRITYIIEMMQAGASGDSARVKEIYREMVAKHFTIDITVMNVMIKALVQSGDVGSAEKLFDILLKQEDRRLEGLKTRLGKVESEKNHYDSTQTRSLRTPFENTLRKQLRIIDFVQHIVNSATSSKPSQSPHPNEATTLDIQKMIPLIPNSHTFGSLLSYYCLVSNNASKVSYLVAQMQKYNIQFTELHFRLLFRGFVGNSKANVSMDHPFSEHGLSHNSQKHQAPSTTGSQDSVGSHNTEGRIAWNAHFLQYITKLMFSQHEALVQQFFSSTFSSSATNLPNSVYGSTGFTSFSPSSFSGNVPGNPFTTRVCAYMFKAYDQIYWYKKKELADIKEGYRRGLQPALNEMEKSPKKTFVSGSELHKVGGINGSDQPAYSTSDAGLFDKGNTDSNQEGELSEKEGTSIDDIEDMRFEEQESICNQTISKRAQSQASVSSVVLKTVERLIKLGSS